jgi:hypothetical protein
VPLELNENLWAALVLHSQDCTVVPFAQAPPLTSTQRPGAPVITSWCGGTAITTGPVGVGLGVGLGGFVVGGGLVVAGGCVVEVVRPGVGVVVRVADGLGLGDGKVSVTDGEGGGRTDPVSTIDGRADRLGAASGSPRFAPNAPTATTIAVRIAVTDAATAPAASQGLRGRRRRCRPMDLASSPSEKPGWRSSRACPSRDRSSSISAVGGPESHR